MKTENHTPFFIGSLLMVLFIVVALIVAQKQDEQKQIQIANQHQQQIEQVAYVQEQQVFESEKDEEVNQLIQEIQKHNKKIINIKHTHGKFIQVTYSN